MLRILTLCHGHPALRPGGTETVAHDLFTALRAQPGCEALFLGCASPLDRSDRSSGRLQSVGRSADELLLWVGAFDRFMLSQTDVRPFVAALSELLASFRPDVVHLHHLSRIGTEAILLIRRLSPSTRILLTLHDYLPICANDGLMRRACAGAACGAPEQAATAAVDAAAPATTPGLCRQASPDACHACFPDVPAARFALRTAHLKGVLRQVDAFIAPSRFLRDRYVAWGLSAERIEVIRNGLPAAEPIAAAKRARRRFGLFGNVAPHKGTLLALEAARQLAVLRADVSLHIHGDIHHQPGSFRELFATALAAAAPLAVHHGGYRREELPSLMAGLDWVLVPSLWWENAPLVIQEAFQHRRPVICSDIGGMAEMVEDGVNGLHVRAGDAADLARTMRRAARQPALWGRLAARLPEPPTLSTTVQTHLALYRALLRNEEALSA